MYKAIPEHCTAAVSSGLGRLFGATTTRTHSREIISSREQMWEVSIAGDWHEARELESVHRELDEYLEEPLETFSRIERVGSIEKVVVFDVLTYWQVRTTFSCLLPINLTSAQTMEKHFPNLFHLAMDILPAQASAVPCECLFSSGKETYTARRNRIRPRLMEALQALKFSSRKGSLNLTEHLSAGFHPLDGGDLEVCETLEAVHNM